MLRQVAFGSSSCGSSENIDHNVSAFSGILSVECFVERLGGGRYTSMDYSRLLRRLVGRPQCEVGFSVWVIVPLRQLLFDFTPMLYRMADTVPEPGAANYSLIRGSSIGLGLSFSSILPYSPDIARRKGTAGAFLAAGDFEPDWT